MSLFPVNAKSLRHRAIRFTDRQVSDGSLIPMFEESGRVKALLVITQDPQAVGMLEWRADLVRTPWSGPVMLDEPTGALRPLTSYQILQAVKLWHFDPDWLLSKMPGADYGPVMAMNCDGRWTSKVGGIFFRRDLSRISLVGIKQAGGGNNIVGWQAKYLPPRPAPMALPLAARAAPPRGGRVVWVLDPIWQR